MIRDDLPRYAACTMTGCARATDGGKPYCADHVERMPYVVALVARTRSAAAGKRNQARRWKRMGRTCGGCGAQDGRVPFAGRAVCNACAVRRCRARKRAA